jgi:hypothetical protein
MGERKRVWVKRVELKSIKYSDDLDVVHDLKLGDHESTRAVISNPKTSDIDGIACGSVLGNTAAGMEGKHANNPIVASSITGTGEKSKSAGVQTDLVMQGCSSGHMRIYLQ